MGIDWRAAIVLAVVVAAALGTVLGLTFGRASGDDEGARYEVTVRFNTSVTQSDLDEVGALLRTYDDDLEFLIMESFPPIGHAVLTTEAPDFCGTVEVELAAKSYVDEATCGSFEDESATDPDTPVQTRN